jgi:hypothetical protein
MKIIFALCLFAPILAGNNRSEQEFVISEKESEPANFPVLQPISKPATTQIINRNNSTSNPNSGLKPISQRSNTALLQSVEISQGSGSLKPLNSNRQINRGSRDGARGSNGRNSTPTRNATSGGRGGKGASVTSLKPISKGPSRGGSNGSGNAGGLKPVTSEFTVMVPEQAQRKQPQGRNVVMNGTNLRNVNQGRGGSSGQSATNQNSSLVSLENNNVGKTSPAGPRFISFGQNQGMDLQYQNLLSKILNFGMLSMFTDLTDQSTKISLMLILKQDKQIAGKDIYKVIFKVENPKYVTGVIYYGAEFAVTAGVMSPNPNQVDFISFGKSVILENLLNLLSIQQDVVDSRKSLTHMNNTKNSEGLDFNQQSKASMVEFIQTILSLTQSEMNGKDGKDCVEKPEVKQPKKAAPLIGNGVGDSFDEFAISGDRI